MMMLKCCHRSKKKNAPPQRGRFDVNDAILNRTVTVHLRCMYGACTDEVRWKGGFVLK